MGDSFFGDTVEKFPVYNLSSIEKELRNYEYKNKLLSLLKIEDPILKRRPYKSKLNSEQIQHNIAMMQIYVR